MDGNMRNCSWPPEVHESFDFGNDTNKVNNFEGPRIRKSGETIEVGITESAIRDSRGQVIARSFIERDISQRKRREVELEQARQDAEVANKTKSDFVANISHELRTPMNAVLGMLQIALDEPLPNALRDYLSTAVESAEHLLLILNDLLDFSRMEAGRFELDPEPFSLRETIENAMKTLAIRAHEKGLELSFEVSPEVPDRLFWRRLSVSTNPDESCRKFDQIHRVGRRCNPGGGQAIRWRQHPLELPGQRYGCWNL